MKKNLRNTVKNYIFTAMKNELRIGNIIQQGTVVDFYQYGVHIGKGITFNYNLCEPEKLSEMWLLKFGFKSTGLSGMVFTMKINAFYEFSMQTDGELWYPQFNNELCSIAEFKYVHQLQNLYYAITGSELRLKRELHPFNQTEKNIQS